MSAKSMADLETPGEATFKDRERKNKGKVWWSNAILFTAMHIFALVGATYLSPMTSLDWRTGVVCIISWQLASFGITLCYHRLYSHRAFTATLPLRIILAWMGSMGFQGSIKWWVLRHRLHHRFTDSPMHDPYAATRGLWWSHCGWIFWKPVYPRMKLIERSDLESDPVVRFQHKHYIPIAIFSGLILPSLIAHFGWNDGLGGLVWGGAVARLLIWHTTFCINSLAHWTGLQPYTEEVTARGNYLLALLTSGEGNHNFHHAFPKDFRNGPHPADWDPTKWIIWILHRFTPLVPSVAVTPETAIRKARAGVHMAEAGRLMMSVPESQRVKDVHELPVWGKGEIRRRHGEWVQDDTMGSASQAMRRRVLLLVEGFVVDVGGYLEDHPGGEQLLLSNAIGPLPSKLVFQSSPSPTSSYEDLIPESPTHDSGYSSGSYTSRKPTKNLTKRPHSTSHPHHDSDPNVTESRDLVISSPKSNTSSLISSAESSDIDDVKPGEVELKDATKAFFGGINNHSGAAKERMRCLRVARFED